MRKLHPALMPKVQGIDGKNWRLVEDFRFYGFDVNLLIPKGFVYDMASIPKAAWLLVGSKSEPEFSGPALIHDFFYVKHRDSTQKFITRKRADYIFRETLKMNGVGLWRRNLMYRAVRLGGYFAWKN